MTRFDVLLPAYREMVVAAAREVGRHEAVVAVAVAVVQIHGMIC
jgi:hypothetical protein